MHKVKLIEDVKDNFGRICGKRKIVANVVDVKIDKASRPWVKLRILDAWGCRARELDQYIRRSAKTVREGEERWQQQQAKRRKQAKKKARRKK